jgi:hypothetical protein
VKLRFRGRQRIHKEYGFQVVNRFVTQTAAYGRADAPPKMLGERDLSVIISPLPRDKRPKAPPASTTITAEVPSAESAPEKTTTTDPGKLSHGDVSQPSPG